MITPADTVREVRASHAPNGAEPGQPGEPDHLSVVREGGFWVLRCETTVARDVTEVFPFFADAGNLERITPAMLRFEIRTPRPIEMGEGVLIDYALRVRGVPVRWRSEIVGWDPPFGFVDRAVRSPYALWHHEHTFEAVLTEHGPATVVRDEVRYRPGGRVLAGLVNRLVVEGDLLEIFRYRTARIAEVFG